MGVHGSNIRGVSLDRLGTSTPEHPNYKASQEKNWSSAGRRLFCGSAEKLLPPDCFTDKAVRRTLARDLRLSQQHPRDEDFIPLAQHKARARAWTPSDEEDLTQEGLMALLEALEQEPNVHNPVAFAATVMRRAMGNFYQGKSTVALFDRTRIKDHFATTRPSGPDDLLIKEYFDFIERACGEESRKIVEELVHPGDEFGQW